MGSSQSKNTLTKESLGSKGRTTAIDTNTGQKVVIDYITSKKNSKQALNDSNVRNQEALQKLAELRTSGRVAR